MQQKSKGRQPRVERRTWRLSAYIEPTIGERVYALARDRGGSVTGIIEAALTEYLAARPLGTMLPLAARLPNQPGRPSKLAMAADAAREERVRKRTGRPWTHAPRDTDTSTANSKGGEQADGT